MTTGNLKYADSSIDQSIIKILIIEDEVTLKEEIASILKFEGFDVLLTDNGKDGLEIANSKSPDLILCDIMMPVMSGTEVLKNLLVSEKTNHIPFIFITALSERTDIRSGMELGADDYLVKPFTVNELLGTIKTRIEKAEMQKKNILTSVSTTKNDLSKRMLQLKEQIAEQNNDLDLLRMETQVQNKNQNEQLSIAGTLLNIETSNRLKNLEKIVNRELQNKQPQVNKEQLFVNLHNEMRKQSPIAKQWSVFQLKFSQLYPLFSENLICTFPNLKQPDLAFASAIAMNLSTLQIASLLNITAASVRKNRYRLKKKIGLQKKENLDAFLHALKSNLV